MNETYVYPLLSPNPLSIVTSNLRLLELFNVSWRLTQHTIFTTVISVIKLKVSTNTNFYCLLDTKFPNFFLISSLKDVMPNQPNFSFHKSDLTKLSLNLPLHCIDPLY